MGRQVAVLLFGGDGHHNLARFEPALTELSSERQAQKVLLRHCRVVEEQGEHADRVPLWVVQLLVEVDLRNATRLFPASLICTTATAPSVRVVTRHETRDTTRHSPHTATERGLVRA